MASTGFLFQSRESSQSQGTQAYNSQRFNAADPEASAQKTPRKPEATSATEAQRKAKDLTHTYRETRRARRRLGEM
jgi:hypothetical protein